MTSPRQPVPAVTPSQMRETATALLARSWVEPPRLGLVLGSGWGEFADREVAEATVVPYGEIPVLPSATAPGHRGRLVLGRVGEVSVAVFQGRFHTYEGHPPEAVVRPIRLLHALGASGVILTNAAGGIRSDLAPGTLMLIGDHVNLIPNPLIGPHDGTWGPRFPDLVDAYDPVWRARARMVAEQIGVPLTEGVYGAGTGPSFETPAEVRAWRLLGADAVGMSTTPETITARQIGLRVLGLSCISNRAAGLSSEPLTEEDVLRVSREAYPRFASLLRALLPVLALD